MKTITDKKMTATKYYTIADMARLLHKPYPTLWHQIMAGVFPAPTILIGNKKYYSAEEFQKIKKEHLTT